MRTFTTTVADFVVFAVSDRITTGIVGVDGALSLSPRYLHLQAPAARDRAPLAAAAKAKPAGSNPGTLGGQRRPSEEGLRLEASGARQWQQSPLHGHRQASRCSMCCSRSMSGRSISAA